MIIVSMTFDRFYSIIRPHKAASFNTVKRAKITIAFVIIFNIVFYSPHLFITSHQGGTCTLYGNGSDSIVNQLYFWFSFAALFALPFILLLIMNSVIIHTINNRSKLMRTQESVSERSGQGQKTKNVEMQIYIVLLLVTFSYLVLTTPGSLFLLYIRYVDNTKSPEALALLNLLYQVGQKAYCTNFGINFFLYVMSRAKFRADLINLFKRKKQLHGGGTGSTEANTNITYTI